MGKTQNYLKDWTRQHVTDVWKVIEAGRNSKDENWQGSGGYAKADSFAKHFANKYRDCKNSNQVREKLKEIVEPSIIWQGDRIRCMKSARTAQCKICMVERKEILKRFQTERNMTINDNSDIYSSCKCGGSFHKFSRIVNNDMTLMKHVLQKKVNSKRLSKPKRKKRTTPIIVSPQTPQICLPCDPARSTSSSTTEESASPYPVTPVFYLTLMCLVSLTGVSQSIPLTSN